MAVGLSLTCDRSALSVASEGADSTAASFNAQLLSSELSQTSEGLTLLSSSEFTHRMETNSLHQTQVEYTFSEQEAKSRLPKCATLPIAKANVVTWIWSMILPLCS